jgi:hypothetical protein
MAKPAEGGLFLKKHFLNSEGWDVKSNLISRDKTILLMITASYIYQHLIKENKNDNNISDIILLSLWVYVETLAIPFFRIKRLC